MPDIETVMSWLEGLTQDDWRQYYSDSEVQETAKAALALLMESEKQKEIDIKLWLKRYGWVGEVR